MAEWSRAERTPVRLTGHSLVPPCPGQLLDGERTLRRIQPPRTLGQVDVQQRLTKEERP